MASENYQEHLAAERTERTHKMLQSLPLSCTDFITSIAMTTSPLTRLAYTIDLGTFCAEKKPSEWTDADIDHFTGRDLRTYADYLTLYFKDETLSEDGTPPKAMRNHECGVMRKLSTLRSYFDFLFKAERISSNIAALVSLPKLHEKPILYLINEEVDRLLSVASDGAALTERQQKFHSLTKTRDVAILMLFLGTGMRVSECVGVNIDDLDFHLNAVLVTRKGGNQVILYFPQEVADALKAYLEERKLIQTDKANENALFLSLQKKRMTQRAVQIMVKKYCAIAVPLKKRMSPHKLRSTYATRLYHETEDIYLVADALGHSDVNTTRKHYAAMSDQRRREAARNVHLPEMDNQTNTNDENRLKMEKQAGKTPEMDS